MFNASESKRANPFAAVVEEIAPIASEKLPVGPFVVIAQFCNPPFNKSTIVQSEEFEKSFVQNGAGAGATEEELDGVANTLSTCLISYIIPVLATFC